MAVKADSMGPEQDFSRLLVKFLLNKRLLKTARCLLHELEVNGHDDQEAARIKDEIDAALHNNDESCTTFEEANCKLISVKLEEGTTSSKDQYSRDDDHVLSLAARDFLDEIVCQVERNILPIDESPKVNSGTEPTQNGNQLLLEANSSTSVTDNAACFETEENSLPIAADFSSKDSSEAANGNAAAVPARVVVNLNCLEEPADEGREPSENEAEVDTDDEAEPSSFTMCDAFGRITLHHQLPEPHDDVVDRASDSSDDWSDDDDPGYRRVPAADDDFFSEDAENSLVEDYVDHQNDTTDFADADDDQDDEDEDGEDDEDETERDSILEQYYNFDQTVASPNELSGPDGVPTVVNTDESSQENDRIFPPDDLGDDLAQDSCNDCTAQTPVPPALDANLVAAAGQATKKASRATKEVPTVSATDRALENTEDELPQIPREVNPVFESFELKIIYERNRTGFEETKDFPIRINSVIAGRYQILEYLGSAAFSKAVQCLDLQTGQLICIKIIKNNKDFFDQSLDEIKLLKYINSSANADDMHVLQLYDYFYHKEHLFIVCELLRDNLYEFSKYNRESGSENYFTLPRLQKITRQCLTALAFIHRLNLIHCDLKPENILIKSYSRCEVKVIDFGSSCFITDHLSSYVQSRSYRAPEVILGMPYGQKIDLWSLGCILAELFTGTVLFHNDSIHSLLARMQSVVGPFPKEMLKRGHYVHKYFTPNYVIYEKDRETAAYTYLYPKKTSLRKRLKVNEANFVDFMTQLLQTLPEKRPTAEAALEHAWLTETVYSDT